MKLSSKLPYTDAQLECLGFRRKTLEKIKNRLIAKTKPFSSHVRLYVDVHFNAYLISGYFLLGSIKNANS